MLNYGSQINAALGRQDFSAILQGAQNQAKAMGQAAAIRAQGISQLGSSAVQAFNTYAENKEKNAVLEGKNTQLLNVLASDPSLNGAILRSPTIQKAIAQRDQKGGLDLKGNTKLFAELSTAYDLAEKSREAQRQQANAEYVRAQTKALVDKAAEDARVRNAMSATMAEIGKLGGNATPQQIINIGVANNMPLDNLRSLVGMNMDVAQLGSALELAKENLKRVQNENAEAERRKNAFEATRLEFGGKTYREIDAENGAKVFQVFDPISGSIKTEVLKAGALPASILAMREKAEEVGRIYDQYRQLLQGDRESPENIAQRDKLAERLNVINPPLDKIGAERNDLDRKWGGGVINPDVPQQGAAAPAGKPSNIKTVSPAPAGVKPTAAAAPTSAGPNLGLAAASTGFMGGAQPFGSPTRTSTQTPTQTPQQDTSIGVPVPPPAPNVVLPSQGADLGLAAAATGFMGRPQPFQSEKPQRVASSIGQDINKAFYNLGRNLDLSAADIEAKARFRKGRPEGLFSPEKRVLLPSDLARQYEGESVSRLPSGKVMSINQILDDPAAAGLGPALAATALTTMQLDPKAKRIANELLEEYERNSAASRGRAPVASLRSSNATAADEEGLYGMPKLRRGDAINQVSERPVALRPKYSKAELEVSRKESRALTDKMMRDQEQLRQLEQMMRSRRSRR